MTNYSLKKAQNTAKDIFLMLKKIPGLEINNVFCLFVNFVNFGYFLNFVLNDGVSSPKPS